MPAPKRLDPDSPLAVWGAELRDFREAAGYNQPQFAQRVNYSVAQISAVETGQQDPTDEFAAHCDAVLGLNGALVRLLKRLRRITAQEIYPEWFRRWPPVEARAAVLRTYELAVLPGLLQTVDYAAVVLGDDGEAIAARMKRQDILTRDDPPPPKLHCVLDLAVLLRDVGGQKVMYEQCQALRNAVSDQISIQVIPCRKHRGISGSFTVATLEDRSEVVYLETASKGMVSTSRDDLTEVADVWESIRTHALPQQESLDLISRTAEERWT
ncbi:Scr1 family TA system antitoxin-like transcriptional regulator [Spirillospora sp. NPDC048911]|uniref:helix-turn-helix domain-containing protein n=1 Tax=Spirillospora sp. NPDC048911 TaxID=3364527 RepID=UPI003716327A